MGGRGGTSGINGKESGLDVTVEGKTTRYYFTSANGQNYYQRGVGGVPEPAPANMSAREFRRRVESNGGITKTVSGAAYRQDQKAYEKDRRETSKFLDATTVNRTAARDSRSDAINNRANRRNRRR